MSLSATATSHLLHDAWQNRVITDDSSLQIVGTLSIKSLHIFETSFKVELIHYYHVGTKVGFENSKLAKPSFTVISSIDFMFNKSTLPFESAFCFSYPELTDRYFGRTVPGRTRPRFRPLTVNQFQFLHSIGQNSPNFRLSSRLPRARQAPLKSDWHQVFSTHAGVPL